MSSLKNIWPTAKRSSLFLQGVSGDEKKNVKPISTGGLSLHAGAVLIEDTLLGRDTSKSNKYPKILNSTPQPYSGKEELSKMIN